jgi:hypothetical protein
MELPSFEKTYYNPEESNFWTKMFMKTCYKSFDYINDGYFINQVERICDMLMIGPFATESEIIFNESIANVNIGLKVFLEDTNMRTKFIRNLKKEYFKIYKNTNIQLPYFIKTYLSLYPDIE